METSWYAALRPLLYHFTAKSNLPSIKHQRRLYSASDLAPACVRDVRRSEVRVSCGGRNVTIRDQRPLQRGHVQLTGGMIAGANLVREAGQESLYQDRSVGGSGGPVAAVHGLTPTRNLAPQMGSGRPGTRIAFSL